MIFFCSYSSSPILNFFGIFLDIQKALKIINRIVSSEINFQPQNVISTDKILNSFLFKKIKIKLEDFCFLKNFIDTTFRYLKTNLKDNKLKHIQKKLISYI